MRSPVLRQPSSTTRGQAFCRVKGCWPYALTGNFDEFASVLGNSKSNSLHRYLVVFSRISRAQLDTRSIVDVTTHVVEMLVESRSLPLVSLSQLLLTGLLHSFCSSLAVFLKNGRIYQLKMAIRLCNPALCGSPIRGCGFGILPAGIRRGRIWWSRGVAIQN